MTCNCNVDDNKQDIIRYLNQYGMLTTGIALYELAFILPDHFQRAIDNLVESGVVRKSFELGRRPVYYLTQDADLALKELFP